MSRSPGRPALPVILVAGEAIWFSLCVSAIANTWPNFSMRIPYFDIALPAIAALLGASFLRRFELGWKQTLAAAGLPVVLLVAVSAGVLSELSVGGSFATVAFQPWAVQGRVPSATSTLAWFLTSLAVARGVQVAYTKETFGRVIRSVVVGALAFFILFLEMATHHVGRLAGATKLAEPLFVCYFLVALVLLRLLRAKDIEGPTAGGDTPTATGIWRIMLAAPLVVVALIAFFIAAALGSWGRPLISAAKAVGRGLGWFFSKIGHGLSYAVVHATTGIASAISWIVALFYHHKGSSTGPKNARTTPTTIAHATGSLGHVSRVEAAVIIAVAVLLGIFGIVRLMRLRPPRPPRVSVHGGEVRSSTFTWRHLLAQLVAGLIALCKLVWHRLVPRHERVAGWRAPPTAETLVGVRRDYQRLLVAARANGMGRAPTETPSEFTRRLAQLVDDPEFARPAQELTAGYEVVRYGLPAGEGDAPARHRDMADRDMAGIVEGLIGRLEALASTAPPTDDLAPAEATVSS